MQATKGSNVKFITEGSILAALAAILGLVGLYIPILGLLTNFLWLVPLIILTLKWGLKKGIMGLLIAGILMGLLSSPISAVFLMLEYGGLALVYGYALNRQYSFEKVLALGTLIAVIGTVIVMALSLSVAGVSYGDMKAEIVAMPGMMMDTYEKSGVLDILVKNGITKEQLQNTLNMAISLMIILLPGIYIISAIITAILSLLISKKVLDKMKMETVFKIPKFRDWRLDWRVIWGFLAGLALYLGGDYFSINILSNIGKNLIFIYIIIFMLSGAAVLIFFWKNVKIAQSLKLLLLLVGIYFFSTAVYLMAIIGMFDFIFDYRNLYKLRGTNK